MENIYIYNTKIGDIGISDNGIGITSISLNPNGKAAKANFKETALIKEAKHQLIEYLEGQRKTFDIILKPEGTPFQKQVWNELLNIPYGKTCSYSEIAAKINNPKAVRAVGMANNKNPILIMIPCHRVIGKNGKLIGYGAGIELKEYLLNLEKPPMQKLD